MPEWLEVVLAILTGLASLVALILGFRAEKRHLEGAKRKEHVHRSVAVDSRDELLSVGENLRVPRATDVEATVLEDDRAELKKLALLARKAVATVAEAWPVAVSSLTKLRLTAADLETATSNQSVAEVLEAYEKLYSALFYLRAYTWEPGEPLPDEEFLRRVTAVRKELSRRDEEKYQLDIEDLRRRAAAVEDRMKEIR